MDITTFWQLNQDRLISLIGDGILQCPDNWNHIFTPKISAKNQQLIDFAKQHILTNQGISNLITSYFNDPTIFYYKTRMASCRIFLMYMQDNTIAIALGWKHNPILPFHHTLYKIENTNGIAHIYYMTTDYARNGFSNSTISVVDDTFEYVETAPECMSDSFVCDRCNEGNPVRWNCFICNHDLCEPCGSSAAKTYDYCDPGLNNGSLIDELHVHKHAMIKNDTVRFFKLKSIDTKNIVTAVMIDGIFKDDTTWYDIPEDEY